jgi:hypothetical protein
MYKYTLTQYEQCPPSLGGNWETGKEIRTSFSRSPRKACEFKGAVSIKHTGEAGCLIMERRTLERNGKVIFDIWD